MNQSNRFHSRDHLGRDRMVVGFITDITEILLKVELNTINQTNPTRVTEILLKLVLKHKSINQSNIYHSFKYENLE